MDNRSKLDGVGPVDNRPSNDKLHHIVKKKTKKMNESDMGHLTPDTWHRTPDNWHVTCNMWPVTRGGGEHSLKILAPQLFRFWKDSVVKIFPQRITQLVPKLITKVFVEQPWLHRVCSISEGWRDICTSTSVISEARGCSINTVVNNWLVMILHPPPLYTPLSTSSCARILP